MIKKIGSKQTQPHLFFAWSCLCVVFGLLVDLIVIVPPGVCGLSDGLLM